MLEMDDGARRLGEVAFGLNYEIDRFTQNTLFDEKIGGTMHVALGSSFEELGGRNESGAALGSRLRPARGRRGLRRRRARLARRALPRVGRARACLTRLRRLAEVLVGYSGGVQARRPDRGRGHDERRAAARGDLRRGATGRRPPGGALRAGAGRRPARRGQRRAGRVADPGGVAGHRAGRRLDRGRGADQHEGADRRRPRARRRASQRARVRLAGALPRARAERRAALGADRLPDERRRPGRGDVARPSTRSFIYAAAFLDDGDPVARWRAFADELQRVAEFLSSKEELRFVAEGTDLTFARRRRPHLGRRRTGTRTSPTARSSRRRSTTAREGEITLHLPGGLPGPAGRRRAPALPRGRGGRGDRLARRGVPRRRWSRSTTARGGWGSSPSA